MLFILLTALVITCSVSTGRLLSFCESNIELHENYFPGYIQIFKIYDEIITIM